MLTCFTTPVSNGEAIVYNFYLSARTVLQLIIKMLNHYTCKHKINTENYNSYIKENKEMLE